MRKCIKRISLVFGAVCFGLMLVCTPVNAITAHAAQRIPDSTQEDRIEWVVNDFNGLVYRRLYNFTTGNWIGDWEYIGTYEEIFGSGG